MDQDSPVRVGGLIGHRSQHGDQVAQCSRPTGRRVPQSASPGPPITAATLAKLSAPAASAIPQKTFNPRHRPQGITSLRLCGDIQSVVSPPRKLAMAPPTISSRNIHRQPPNCNRPAELTSKHFPNRAPDRSLRCTQKLSCRYSRHRDIGHVLSLLKRRWRKLRPKQEMKARGRQPSAKTIPRPLTPVHGRAVSLRGTKSLFALSRGL